MEGTYRFYIDGDLVAEHKNALTQAGRSIIIKSLLGIIPNFADTIAYGIGNNANTLSASGSLITNTTLDFEVGRTRVIGSSVLIENNNDILVYSGTIDDPEQFYINEVALFPSFINETTIGVDGSLILNFDSVDLFTKYGTASAAALVSSNQARVGTDMLMIPDTSDSESYLEYVSTDDTLSYLNNFVSQDSFRLAGFNPNTNSASVSIEFYNNSSNYYQVIFNTPSASGYFVQYANKNSAIVTGTPNWEDVGSIRIWHNSASPIYLDGIRIDRGSYQFDSNYGMISRAVLKTPIRKPASIPLTIEYSLSLGFNYGVS